MMLTKRRAKAVAPDIAAYRGQSGRGVARAQAEGFIALLRTGGVTPDATVGGTGHLEAPGHLSLDGYRAVEDEGAVGIALGSWVSSSLGTGHAASMLVSRRSGLVSCTYSGPGTDVLRASIPDVRPKDIGHAHRPMPFHLAVLGVPGTCVDYDAVLDATQGHDLDVQAMVLPAPSAARQLDGLSSISALFDPYGEGGARRGANGGMAVVREVEDLLDLCDRVREELASHPQRARLVFRVSAGDTKVLNLAASAIEGCCRPFDRNPYKLPFAKGWPEACLGGYPLMDGGDPLAYEMAVEDAVRAVTPPRESHAGFTVSMSSAHSSRRAFLGVGTEPPGQRPRYRLGICENDGRPVDVAMCSMPSAFVTGVPGTGKTTALLNLVSSAAKAGVPFCCLEVSTKREFARGLIASVPNVEVLGIGAAAGNAPLRMNPLWVAPGTQIDGHVQNVSATLLMAAAGDDQEAPIPQAMEALVKDAYRRFRWQPSDIAYERDGGYPTLLDLDVGAYVKHLGYEPRVKANVAQALGVRIDHLLTHRSMLCPQGTSDFWRITGGSSVLELGALGERSAALVATCLLRQILEWSSSLPDLAPGAMPRLVVVLDEINAILSYEGAGRPFSALLERAFRELRAKGVVLVCAGQQAPGDDVGMGIMANAACRMAFRADWQRDAEAIAGALGLEPFQRRLLGSLPSHHAVVKLPGGRSDAIPVRTLPHDDGGPTARHAACLSCAWRLACGTHRASAEAQLGNVPSNVSDRLCSSVSLTPYDPMAIMVARRAVEAGAASAGAGHCLVGLCLEAGGVPFDLARLAFVDVHGGGQ